MNQPPEAWNELLHSIDLHQSGNKELVRTMCSDRNALHGAHGKLREFDLELITAHLLKGTPTTFSLDIGYLFRFRILFTLGKGIEIMLVDWQAGKTVATKKVTGLILGLQNFLILVLYYVTKLEIECLIH